LPFRAPVARRGTLPISRFHTHADPTHVIAVLVAATHRAAASGAVIDYVGVVSRLRGNDVLGDGWSREWRAVRLPVRAQAARCGALPICRPCLPAHPTHVIAAPVAATHRAAATGTAIGHVEVGAVGSRYKCNTLN